MGSRNEVKGNRDQDTTRRNWCGPYVEAHSDSKTQLANSRDAQWIRGLAFTSSRQGNRIFISVLDPLGPFLLSMTSVASLYGSMGSSILFLSSLCPQKMTSVGRVYYLPAARAARWTRETHGDETDTLTKVKVNLGRPSVDFSQFPVIIRRWRNQARVFKNLPDLWDESTWGFNEE